jgi:hypothetical protein
MHRLCARHLSLSFHLRKMTALEWVQFPNGARPIPDGARPIRDGARRVEHANAEGEVRRWFTGAYADLSMYAGRSAILRSSQGAGRIGQDDQSGVS